MRRSNLTFCQIGDELPPLPTNEIKPLSEPELLTLSRLSPPRSLLSRSPQHQGVFWPDQKSQKLKFQVSFLGLNIALTPNLIGSSDADFHKDSESGLNSKIKKNTKESFVQITVELTLMNAHYLMSMDSDSLESGVIQL